MAAQWKFYGRREDLGALLSYMRDDRWFFGSIRGRRRIGKSTLVSQALAQLGRDSGGRSRSLHFELPDSNASVVAKELRDTVARENLSEAVPNVENVRDLTDIGNVIEALCRNGVLVVIDEFQHCVIEELKGFTSILKTRVDRLSAANASGGLIVLGSVQREMESLLLNYRAPLFGRTTFNLTLHPWSLRTIFEVCDDLSVTDPNRWLTLWTLFGGVPYYWHIKSLIQDNNSQDSWYEWASHICEELFLRRGAFLRDEAQRLLRHEMRRDFYTVVNAIAACRTCTFADLRNQFPDRTDIEEFLKSLIDDLDIVEKQTPVMAGGRSRVARYRIADHFLSAWYTFIRQAVQKTRNWSSEDIVSILVPKLQTLEGQVFEQMVRESTVELSRSGHPNFRRIEDVRGYWSRPSREHSDIEIDYIGWHEELQKVRFGSCKRNESKHTIRSLSSFRNNVEAFLATKVGRKFREWNCEYVLFSPVFSDRRRSHLVRAGWTCMDLTDFRYMLRERDNGQDGELLTYQGVWRES